MNRTLIDQETPDSGMRPTQAPVVDTTCSVGCPESRGTPVVDCRSTSSARDPYLARTVKSAYFAGRTLLRHGYRLGSGRCNQ